jgi:hypothetical protein
MTQELRREDFELFIGQRMLARIDAETFELEVGAVAPIANPSPRQHPPFALTMLDRSRRPVRQGIYRLTHPSLGEIDIFLVPIGPKDGAMRFEAVFN